MTWVLIGFQSFRANLFASVAILCVASLSLCGCKKGPDYAPIDAYASDVAHAKANVFAELDSGTNHASQVWRDLRTGPGLHNAAAGSVLNSESNGWHIVVTGNSLFWDRYILEMAIDADVNSQFNVVEIKEPRVTVAELSHILPSSSTNGWPGYSLTTNQVRLSFEDWQRFASNQFDLRTLGINPITNAPISGATNLLRF